MKTDTSEGRADHCSVLALTGCQVSNTGSYVRVACVLRDPCWTTGAADKTKLDQATKRVERGAEQVGQGQVSLGFREMLAGIGHTVVEGAKFSGENVKEFSRVSIHGAAHDKAAARSAYGYQGRSISRGSNR